jgi:hypothetical protein
VPLFEMTLKLFLKDFSFGEASLTG